MSVSFAPPVVSGHHFASGCKRSVPSGGFHDDTLSWKRSRVQNENRIASLSSGSLRQVPSVSVSFQGPKSLEQIKAERSAKTSSTQNLARSDSLPYIGSKIRIIQPAAAATTVFKVGSRSDSYRDFQGPKSLVDILKEKHQRRAVITGNSVDKESVQALHTTSLSSSSTPSASKGHDHHVDKLKQKPDGVAVDLEELEEGEIEPSNDKHDDACHDSSPCYSSSSLSSASASTIQDLDAGSKPASSMLPAGYVESQLTPASKGNETNLGTAQLEDGQSVDDDAAFDDDDIDIDDAQLELYFSEADYVACENYSKSQLTASSEGNETTLGKVQIVKDDDQSDIDVDDDDIDIDDAQLELYFSEADYIACENYSKSQLAAASEGNETTLGKVQVVKDDDRSDIDVDDDAAFDDDDIDIDNAQLELYFSEADYIACKNYVTSCS